MIDLNEEIKKLRRLGDDLNNFKELPNRIIEGYEDQLPKKDRGRLLSLAKKVKGLSDKKDFKALEKLKKEFLKDASKD